jgi:hypothetical protein
METIPIQGAEIYYDKNFLSPEEATTFFNLLQTKCAWERRRASFKYAVPRDEAYYGDPGTNYTYSRREYNHQQRQRQCGHHPRTGRSRDPCGCSPAGPSTPFRPCMTRSTKYRWNEFSPNSWQILELPVSSCLNGWPSLWACRCSICSPLCLTVFSAA